MSELDSESGLGKLRYRWFCECHVCSTVSSVYTKEESDRFLQEHGQHKNAQYKLAATLFLLSKK